MLNYFKAEQMIEYTKRGKKRTIKLGATLTIEHATELHKALKACLKADQVTLELSKLESVDLPILQLILSAKQSYTAQNKKLDYDFTEIEKRTGILSRNGIHNF